MSAGPQATVFRLKRGAEIAARRHVLHQKYRLSWPDRLLSAAASVILIAAMAGGLLFSLGIPSAMLLFLWWEDRER